jgi:uncharacterized YigZ family protein
LEESYNTLGGPHRHEIDKIKGSRFLGLVMPLEDEAQAKEFLLRCRKEFHSARHHCSAWRLRAAGGEFRYSDDGEPNGSAGKPILAAIDGRQLVDLAVVVVRWFGGTKLGVGGLVRAYGQAAADALDQAQTKVVVLGRHFTFHHGYEVSGPIGGLLSEFDFEPQSAIYGADVQFDLEIPLARCEAFLAAFVERTSGQGRVVEHNGPSRD